MDTQVVFVGSATLDTIALTDEPAEADERRVALELDFAGGGPAATAAVTCARLGVPATFIGSVGDDAEGQRIMQDLSSEGVDISAVRARPHTRSGASVVVVSQARAGRAIFTRQLPELDVGEAARDLLRAASWIHADHLGWPVVQDMKAKGEIRGKLSVDGGNPIVPFDLADVDLYVPNAAGLERDFGHGEMSELARAARRAGAGTVVVTIGSHGAVAYTDNHERINVAGCHVDVVSTLGAGDVFHGALLAATVHNLPLPLRVRYAVVAAALSCRALGGRAAIPTHADVMSVIDTTKERVQA